MIRCPECKELVPELREGSCWCCSWNSFYGDIIKIEEQKERGIIHIQHYPIGSQTQFKKEVESWRKNGFVVETKEGEFLEMIVWDS